MSLMNAPSKDEVMAWNPLSLADYMRQLNLSSCDRVVMKASITGAHFMHMTQSQLEMFPSLYIPILTEIQREINMGEQRKACSLRSKTQKASEKVFVQDEVWESDEFSSESDNEYEWHKPKTEEEKYVCPPADPQPAEIAAKPPQFPKALDNHREKSSKTPHKNSTRIQPSPQQSFQSTSDVLYPNLQRDKSTNPGNLSSSQRTLSLLKGSTSSSTSNIPQPGAHPTKDVLNRNRKPPPPPPVPPLPFKLNKPTSAPKKCLDPRWYGGQLTRLQAEVALRSVSKDGAFLVRDSSKGSDEHPYTLMLLSQGQIYNIRIRHQGISYLLGNGLNSTKSFPGVKEMIIHYMSSPLWLIKATDQSSDQHQCCLLHPAVP